MTRKAWRGRPTSRCAWAGPRKPSTWLPGLGGGASTPWPRGLWGWSACGDGIDLGPAYALRGLLNLERGRLLKALPDAERALTLAPREPGGYYVRGRVRLERGDATALADLTRAEELSEHKDGLILHWR